MRVVATTNTSTNSLGTAEAGDPVMFNGDVIGTIVSVNQENPALPVKFDLDLPWSMAPVLLKLSKHCRWNHGLKLSVGRLNGKRVLRLDGVATAPDKSDHITLSNANDDAGRWGEI